MSKNIINGEYTSVWDTHVQGGPGYEITTPCEIDLESGAVEAESVDHVEHLNALDRAYVEVSGQKFMMDKDDPDSLSKESLAALQLFNQAATSPRL